MLFDDTYRTIETPCEGAFSDRGSKFISFAYPISHESDLKSTIALLKAQHQKANHHCWAMRLGPDRSVYRINDDGEPAGTAGRPILNVLLSRDITNTLIVVVRYFGGTLLGVPGLINAYRCAAEDALNQAIIHEKTINDIYTIEFDYLQMNEVMRIIKQENLSPVSQEFDNKCMLKLGIRKTKVNQVLLKLGKLDGIKVTYETSL